MSARYSLVFVILALGFAGAGIAAWAVLGIAVIVPLYAAFSFLLLSAAYAGLGPRLLRKRADGRLHPLTWLLFGPYLLLNALAFRLYRIGSSRPAYGLAAPNLYFGRRLTPSEVHGPGSVTWQGVLDLAAEFPEVKGLRTVPRYRSLPILDATAPTGAQLQEAVTWLRESVAVGPVYVHCALGHGRTATFVIAYLLATGQVATVREGLARLRAMRPGVGLHRQQAEQLRRLEPDASKEPPCFPPARAPSSSTR